MTAKASPPVCPPALHRLSCSARIGAAHRWHELGLDAGSKGGCLARLIVTSLSASWRPRGLHLSLSLVAISDQWTDQAVRVLLQVSSPQRDRESLGFITSPARPFHLSLSGCFNSSQVLLCRGRGGRHPPAPATHGSVGQRTSR